MHQTIILILTVIAVSSRSFVDNAAIKEDSGIARNELNDKDNTVAELENLKHYLGNSLELIKEQSSVYSNINGKENARSSNKKEAKENGKLLESVSQQINRNKDDDDDNPSQTIIKTNLNIPSLGIYKTRFDEKKRKSNDNTPTMSDLGNQIASTREKYYSDLSNTVDDVYESSKGKYSALDMAEYIFWTGDEKGVVLGITDLLQEKMMSREEALVLVQEIKYNLDYLKTHYSQLGMNFRELLNKQQNDREDKYPSTLNLQEYSSLHQPDQKMELHENIPLKQDAEGVNRKRASNQGNPEKLESTQAKITEVDKTENEHQLLEKIQTADFLYTEYSLEEIIYQLSKVMFYQSLSHGSAEAEESLTKFITFLDTETRSERISKSLEKKVLDVLIAALTDTLAEHPELLKVDKANANYIKQQYLREVLAQRLSSPIDFYPKSINDQTDNKKNQYKDLSLIFPMELMKFKKP